MSWKIIARSLTEKEAEEYARIVRREQLYNNRKDAKFIKAEQSKDDQTWYVFVTSHWPDLSDDEIRRYSNMGIL